MYICVYKCLCVCKTNSYPKRRRYSPFSRPRALFFFKHSFCVSSRRFDLTLNTPFFCITKKKLLNQYVSSFPFYYHQNMLSDAEFKNYWFIQIRNIMILPQNVQISEDCLPTKTYFSYKITKSPQERNT